MWVNYTNSCFVCKFKVPGHQYSERVTFTDAWWRQYARIRTWRREWWCGWHCRGSCTPHTDTSGARDSSTHYSRVTWRTCRSIQPFQLLCILPCCIHTVWHTIWHELPDKEQVIRLVLTSRGKSNISGVWCCRRGVIRRANKCSETEFINKIGWGATRLSFSIAFIENKRRGAAVWCGVQPALVLALRWFTYDTWRRGNI